jgi:hypothetical protein
VYVKRYAEVAKTHYVGCTTTASTNFNTPATKTATSTEAVGTKIKHSGSVEGDAEPNKKK